MSEELKKEWEEQFESKFVRTNMKDVGEVVGMTLNNEILFSGEEKDIKSFISSLLAKQQEMTNSEWVAYGKAKGYHDYWKDMTRIALQEEFVNEVCETISQYSGISDVATRDLLADIKSKLNNTEREK